MKKAGLFLLVFILLSSCTQQNLSATGTPTSLSATSTMTPTNTLTPTITLTSRPTSIPTPTLIPCPSEGTPIIIDDIQIYFDNGVPQSECNLFIIYTQKFNEWMRQNGYKTGSIRVSVFSDDQRVTDFIYDWASSHGCHPDTKANIFALWNERGKQGGTQAMSTYGASFYQVFNGDWARVDLNEKLVGIIGEEINVAHLNYAGSCQRFWLVPDWFQDSGSALAVQLESIWGVEPQDDTDWWNSNPKCKTIPLAQTQAGHPCLYLNSRQAFRLLTKLYGQKSFQVYELVGKGKSFSTAFREVYGISELDFYRVYDEFRASGFGAAATPTLPPDTGISGKVTWDTSYPNKGFDQYLLYFCPIEGGDCLGGIAIQPDGSFVQHLPSGYYFISLNYTYDSPPIGWYISTGMVKANNCAGLVQVTEGSITNIDFKVNSPTPCR